MTDSTEPLGATPGQDTSGLLLHNKSSREEINAAETEAIDKASTKYVHRARKKSRDSEWLTDEFIRKVHHDMFGEVWDWAGKYRTMIQKHESICIIINDGRSSGPRHNTAEQTVVIDHRN